MKKFVSLLVLLTTAFTNLAPIFAQQTPKTGDDEVVRISTNLVQLDAVVTDKDGKPATNLTAADFEVFQDGKAQRITSLSYINTEVPENPDATKKSDENAATVAPPAVPAARLENAGRILTFVVDDGNCRASRIGITASREALVKFVNEQMRPDDLVAIYQTRSGSSVLQQYTSNKAQLMRVVGKIRWYPPKGICGNDAGGDSFDPARTTGTGKETGAKSFESPTDRENRSKIENRAKDNQVNGFLGVLRYITRGLQKVSGRKTVFLLSDGLPLFSVDPALRGSENSVVATMKLGDSLGTMRDLIDQANRASVVFNTIDVRGVFTPGGGASAQDDFEGFRNNINATGNQTALRISESSNAESGMFYLANETGGRFYQGSNNLDIHLRRALNLEKGYYLIGYQPDENTFKSKKFNKIEVKVKRADLNVRSRSGFFGVTDETLRPKKRTGDSELYEALVAPLPNAGLDLRVTAFFGNTAAEGSFVQTLLYLDGEQITFTDEPNGMKKAVFDVIAVTLDEKNEVVEEFNRTHTIRFPAANLAGVRQNGVIYMADVPVKRAGVYNFRVAVRDAASRLIGSAGQQVEVPDLKKNNLFLSGLIVSEVTVENGKPMLPSVEKARNEFAPVAADSIPAIRRFRPGAILGYSYKIYNAAPDKTAGQPKLTAQIRLYKDGQTVIESAPQGIELQAQNDATRLSDFGYLRLPPDTQTGDYALQIIIKDAQKNETVSQWIDFEVVN